MCKVTGYTREGGFVEAFRTECRRVRAFLRAVFPDGLVERLSDGSYRVRGCFERRYFVEDEESRA